MNTNQIKKFACEARVKLIKGVENALLGFFDKKGNAHEEPVKVQGGCLFKGQPHNEAFFRNWCALNKQVQLYGMKEVCETVAYTWFNRLVAIQILAKNHLAEPVLAFPNPRARVPFIVEQARAGQISAAMSVATRQELNELLNDDSKTFAQFKILIEQYCRDNAVVNKCFGKIDDFSMMLLPADILKEGEFVDMLNNSEFISEEDYTKSELIGWLYQFYISEKKDEVFAKKGKFESDEIPAATQIFTPNWIVKYMVQNSLGRIYLDSEPYSGIADKMQYLVEADKSADKFAWTDVKELTCADLACGSGHILNECFDLLYDIYIEQGYSRKQAIEGIFAHNLVGVDLDTRAKQLATFALILKACQRDASFADAHAMPRVYDMPDPYPRKMDLRDILSHFFLGGNPKMIAETMEAIELMDQAKNLGSIMKFDISPATREAIAMRLNEYRSEGHTDFDGLFHYLDIILTLTQKYAALIANPPYMGRGHMTDGLSKYLDKHYLNTKADLFATFMEMMLDHTRKQGRTAFITMESWMFLSSYEKFRKDIIDNYYISSLGHFGWHIIGIAFGTVMTVIQKSKPNGRKGEYSYLTIDDVDRTVNIPYVFPKKDNGRYAVISQDNFEKIPGCPIGYWVSERMIEAFTKSLVKDYGYAGIGMRTGDNVRFLRRWFEVSLHKCSFSHNGNKWFPYNKGGEFRRWFGNNEYLVNWENNGEEIKENTKLNYPELGDNLSWKITNEAYYFKPGITWTGVSSKAFNCRIYEEGFIFDSGANGLFASNDSDKWLLLSYLNSNVANSFLEILNPTINYGAGTIREIPVPNIETSLICDNTKQNVAISKQDWDAHETSWDFQENELIRMKQYCGGNCADLDMLSEEDAKAIKEIVHVPTNGNLIEDCYLAYMNEWTKKFYQLHRNEEELNRQFIEIYGLEDELTPDVPLDEVTILQQGEISIENGRIVWHPEVAIKQLISYAVGCWFGRYRLDKPGLHIAHPEPTEEEVCEYTYRGKSFEIDDDGIMPILSADSSFADNACHRLRDFVRITFGEEHLQDNINFIEATLGKTLEAYFVKDFWKEHKKMYQNRPIYWLFASKKGAFQCLVYMHRMNAYTAERVRSKYLLPHMEDLTNRIKEMTSDAAMLSTAQRRTLDRLVKELDECREYHDRLHLVADQQIGFDLDDGVVVNYAKFGDVLAKIK